MTRTCASHQTPFLVDDVAARHEANCSLRLCFRRNDSGAADQPRCQLCCTGFTLLLFSAISTYTSPVVRQKDLEPAVRSRRSRILIFTRSEHTKGRTP